MTTTLNSHQIHAVGDTVHINPDYFGRVPAAFHAQSLKITGMPRGSNGVNATVRADDGRGLRLPPFMLLAGPATGITKMIPYVPQELHQPGTVVWYQPDRKPRSLYVVTGVSDKGHRLFLLGGSDRYFRNVPASLLTVVDPAGLVAHA
jgi:hypothetical protein